MFWELFFFKLWSLISLQPALAKRSLLRPKKQKLHWGGWNLRKVDRYLKLLLQKIFLEMVQTVHFDVFQTDYSDLKSEYFKA